jgi:hypothetical protein
MNLNAKLEKRILVKRKISFLSKDRLKLGRKLKRIIKAHWQIDLCFSGGKSSKYQDDANKAEIQTEQPAAIIRSTETMETVMPVHKTSGRNESSFWDIV